MTFNGKFFRIFIVLFLISLFIFIFNFYKSNGSKLEQNPTVFENFESQEAEVPEINGAANSFINIQLFNNPDPNLTNGRIVGISPDKKELDVDFDYSGNGKVVENISVRCSEEESASFYADLAFLDSGKLITDTAEIGNYIYSYCGDAECTEFINMCILIVN